MPTRGSRLYIAHWYPASKNSIWNGPANNWGGGTPGDGKEYQVKTYISSVKVTPFNEPNDIMYMGTVDKPGNPGNCVKPYNSKYDSCHPVWDSQLIPRPAEVLIPLKNMHINLFIYNIYYNLYM